MRTPRGNAQPGRSWSREPSRMLHDLRAELRPAGSHASPLRRARWHSRGTRSSGIATALGPRVPPVLLCIRLSPVVGSIIVVVVVVVGAPQ